MFEIFLSYCWADDKVADTIFDTLSMNQGINIHRDKIDLGNWQSINEYMQSISQMDYTILLVSDAYLKSKNCMYEVLEVMRNRKYSEKIFPAVIYTGIYEPLIRANYVKYWQDKSNELEKSLETLDKQNLGSLVTDLKQFKDIAANVADFLALVAKLNNPQLTNISEAIVQKLNEKGLLSTLKKDNCQLESNDSLSIDYFKKLNINSPIHNEVTDLDIHRYMIQCFQNVNMLFKNLCEQLEKQNTGYDIIWEERDSRTIIYDFYKNGQSKKKLQIFLDESFGILNMGVSDNLYTFGNGKSWNEMYTPQSIEGNIIISNMTNMNKRKTLSAEEIVKDIWERFVNPYI